MAVLQGTPEAATAGEADGQGGAQSGSLHGIFGYPFLVAVWGGGGVMVPSHLYRNSMK